MSHVATINAAQVAAHFYFSLNITNLYVILAIVSILT